MPSSVSRTKAVAVLRDRFGHSDFRRGQWEPVRSVLSGRDALVVMPTESGKSIVFPLRALMLHRRQSAHRAVMRATYSRRMR